MPARHRSRLRALQLLYLLDMRKQPLGEVLQGYYSTLGTDEDSPQRMEPDEFMETLVRGTSEHAAALDERITKSSEHWRLDRMPVVDRNILRMAVYEMTELGTPPAVAIDEALELARQFSGDQSVSFINGVLDAVHKNQP